MLRHELAHLALHESLGDVPPRWFDEGYASYAANEWGRDDVLTANVALVLGRIPPLDSLDAGFSAGARRAAATYALAYRAVAEMATLDSLRGLSLFFEYWKESGKLDPALRRAFTYTQAEFEQLWKKRTRRRYGGLALIADLSLVAVLFAALLVPLYAARRQRDKLRMAALVKADEDAERRDRESAIDALLSTLPPAPPKPPPSTSPDQAPNS